MQASISTSFESRVWSLTSCISGVREDARHFSRHCHLGDLCDLWFRMGPHHRQTQIPLASCTSFTKGDYIVLLLISLHTSRVNFVSYCLEPWEILKENLQVFFFLSRYCILLALITLCVQPPPFLYSWSYPFCSVISMEVQSPVSSLRNCLQLSSLAYILWTRLIVA